MADHPGQTAQYLAEILGELRGLSESVTYARALLDAYVVREAALLPARTVEIVELSSAQSPGPLATATSTTVRAQTGDVEIVEGIVVGALGAAGLVVELALDSDVSFQLSPPAILSPLSLPIAAGTRTLTYVTGTYTSATALIWGHVAPARTHVVH